MISGLIGFVFIIGLTAAITVGAAFFLRIMTPSSSVKKRTAFAALIGGFIPMLLPMATLIIATDAMPGSLIALLALAILAFLLAGLVGFPSAYFFNKRFEKPVDPSTFE